MPLSIKKTLGFNSYEDFVAYGEEECPKKSKMR